MYPSCIAKASYHLTAWQCQTRGSATGEKAAPEMPRTLLPRVPFTSPPWTLQVLRAEYAHPRTKAFLLRISPFSPPLSSDLCLAQDPLSLQLLPNFWLLKQLSKKEGGVRKWEISAPPCGAEAATSFLLPQNVCPGSCSQQPELCPWH